ncbi:hypothetical protein GQX74_014214 [Glossina fuscipes]|nr:hypothetical protein GQX74_014214 [Glossina fuscipes]
MEKQSEMKMIKKNEKNNKNNGNNIKERNSHLRCGYDAAVKRKCSHHKNHEMYAEICTELYGVTHACLLFYMIFVLCSQQIWHMVYTNIYISTSFWIMDSHGAIGKYVHVGNLASEFTFSKSSYLQSNIKLNEMLEKQILLHTLLHIHMHNL